MSTAAIPSVTTAGASRSYLLPIIGLAGCGLVLMLAQRVALATFFGGPLRVDLYFTDDVVWLLGWVLFAPVVIWTARRGVRMSSAGPAVALHAMAAVTTILLHLAVTGMVARLLGRAAFQATVTYDVLFPLGWRLLPGAMVYALLVFIVTTRATMLAAAPAAQPMPVDAGPVARRPLSAGSIALVDGGRTLLFEAVEVAWIKASDDYVEVHARGKTWLIRESLDSLERRLPSPPFHRTHRSAIVNLRHVTEVVRTSRHRHMALLRDGTRVPVSATRRIALDERVQARAME